MWRSRSVNSNEQRFTSRPPDDGAGVGAHNLDYHSDVTITGVADEDLLVYDSGTGQWINASLSDLTDTHPIAAHAEADATHSLTAAANNTWQVVPWSTSLISSVTVCPLSFYTAGGSLFTVPEDGYYDAELTIALAADPDLFGSTLEFGLFVNNTLVRTFYCSSNDWSLSYAGVLEELSANDTVEIKFRRNGAGYATAVDLSSRSNFSLHKIAAVGFGGATAHALNAHTDTNFPSPTNGQAITWNSGTSRWVATTLTSPAHTFGSHSDANANLTSPGAGLDQYVVVWDQASTSFKLVLNSAVAAAHALGSHSDTNLGSPGAPEDGYVVAWDDGAGEYVLVAPTAPGAHTLDSHSNVTITAAAANHKLRWNGSAWVNVLDNLDSLSDVVITLAATGDILYYDGTNWVDYPFATLLAGHNHTLDGLSNVSTAGKATGDFLWWNGTAWAHRGIRLNDLFDVVSTAPTTGQGLIWDGSNWVPGSVTATVTAAWGYFYSNASGFLAGSGSGTSLNTGVSPNRFTVSTAGVWLFQVHCSGSSTPGDLSISTSAGGSTPGTTYSNTCLASLGAGGYFTITGPSAVGNYYSITLTKVGS